MRLYPDELIRHEWMRDGTPVALRPIRPEDVSAWCAMISACSPKSIWLRFERQFKEVPVDLAVQFCSIDYEHEIAIVAEIEEAGARKLIGIGQLFADPDHATAEYAVLVANPWQGKGLGSRLTDFCLEIARRWGVKKVVTEISPSNVRTIRLLHSRGFQFQRNQQDQIVLGEKSLD